MEKSKKTLQFYDTKNCPTLIYNPLFNDEWFALECVNIKVIQCFLPNLLFF